MDKNWKHFKFEAISLPEFLFSVEDYHVDRQSV